MSQFGFPYINTNITSPLANITKLITESIISDNVKSKSLRNYLGPWNNQTEYITGDFVVHNNQLFKSLVTNVGIEPVYNNISQTEWEIITSNNNTGFNDSNIIKLNKLTGNDSKALISNVPFKTILEAINAVSTISLNSKSIEMTTLSEVYDPFDCENINNLMIFGRIGCNCLDIQLNRFNGLCQFTNCEKMRLQYLEFYDNGNNPCLNLNGIKGHSVIDSCSFNKSTNSTTITIQDNGAIPWNAVVNISNCSSSNDLIESIVELSGGTPDSQVRIINWLGPLSLRLTDTFKGFCYVYRCTGMNVLQHSSGILVIDRVAFFSGNLNSDANNGDGFLIVQGGALLNPFSGQYGNINKTGDCPYLFNDFEFSPNNIISLNSSPGSRINGAIGRQIYSKIGPSINSVSLLPSTNVQIPFESFEFNNYNIVELNNSNLIFKQSGEYTITLTLTYQTVSSMPITINTWFGKTSSTNPFDTTFTQNSFTRNYSFPGGLDSFTQQTYSGTIIDNDVFSNTEFTIYAFNISGPFDVRLLSVNIIKYS